MSKKVYYSLYGRMLEKRRLFEAFKKVKRTKGAGGIDGQSIEVFTENLDYNITRLQEELKDKSYRPLPVKRVEIPKDTGGVRMLGIPAIRDRIVQQALLEIMQPIFEEDFHPSSYGYRPGRSCHQAISKATMFIRKYDLSYVVDMDLSKCFDTLNHDYILKCIRKRVTDSSILNLIGLFLGSGVMVGDYFEETKTGSPQGGVISPLIANIYLNEFDQFMKGRKYRIVRYADDILILCKSQRSAEKALKVSQDYLENKQKLKVNKEKTHITHSSNGVKFLGVEIFKNFTKIQEKKIVGFKEKVKGLTRKNQGGNLPMILKRLNPILRGFSNYFRIANCNIVLSKLMQWVRRRLRMVQLKLWKKPAKLHRRLRQLGYKGNFDFIKMDRWRNSACPLAHYSMPNSWFKSIGLYDLESINTGIVVPC